MNDMPNRFREEARAEEVIDLPPLEHAIAALRLKEKGSTLDEAKHNLQALMKVEMECSFSLRVSLTRDHASIHCLR